MPVLNTIGKNIPNNLLVPGENNAKEGYTRHPSLNAKMVSNRKLINKPIAIIYVYCEIVRLG